MEKSRRKAVLAVRERRRIRKSYIWRMEKIYRIIKEYAQRMEKFQEKI